MEKLDLLVRFWELRVRYEALGMPLNKQERLELLSLLQLVASADEASPIEALDTSRRGIPVQLTAGSGFLSGELKDLTYDRLIVATAEPMPMGHRTIVYLADAVTGVEYTLPCSVTRSRNGEPCRFRVIERQIVDGQIASARADCARGRCPTIRQGKPGVSATARDLKCESSEPRIRCRALDRHTR